MAEGIAFERSLMEGVIASLQYGEYTILKCVIIIIANIQLY